MAVSRRLHVCITVPPVDENHPGFYFAISDLVSYSSPTLFPARSSLLSAALTNHLLRNRT